MPNVQLVDYVVQQTKGGVAAEVIKKALVDTGWPQSDVDDAMKTATGGGAPAQAQASSMQPQVKPAAMGASVASSPAQTVSPAISQKPAVSVSVFDVKSGPAFEAKDKKQEPVVASVSAVAAAKPVVVTTSASPTKSHPIIPIIMGVIIVAMGVGLYFFWSQGASLGAQVATLDADKTTLTTQVEGLTKDKESLTARVDTLTVENADLANHWALLGSATSPSTVTIRGTLSGSDKIAYSLTTSKGVVLAIKNYKDAKVMPVLTPLIGESIEVTGTRGVGAKDITVTAVNGQSVTP